MHHHDTVKKSFNGQLWSTLPDNDPNGQHQKAINDFGLKYVRGTATKAGLTRNNMITYGGNSGYQAIHLAYNFGASDIYLLGYDFKGSGQHFFGKHPTPLNSGHDFARWLKDIAVLARDLKNQGVRMVNLSRDTAITCIPRMNIADITVNGT